MRQRTGCLAVVVILFAGLAPARGDIVSVDVSGPGGSGFGIVNSPTEALYDISYNVVTYDDISVQVNSGGTYLLDTKYSDIHILNVTPSDWSAFAFQSLSGATFTAATELHAPNDFGPPIVSPSVVLFTGGTGVTSQNPFFYPGLTFTAPTAGTYVFRATPAVGSSAVPEPSPLALLGLLAFLGGARSTWRRREIRGDGGTLTAGVVKATG